MVLVRSVLDARKRVMLEVNVPSDRLESVVAILPCMREPTISPLHHDAGFAVKAAVPRADLPELIRVDQGARRHRHRRLRDRADRAVSDPWRRRAVPASSGGPPRPRSRVELNLDGEGQAEVETGLGFLDHMLTALAKHGRFDLELECEGDLDVDDHHTAEDCALALGTALRPGAGRAARHRAASATPTRRSTRRWRGSWSTSPAGPSADVDLGFRRERIGDIATENLTHFFVSLATTARMTLHVDVLKGDERPSPRRGRVQGAGPGPARRRWPSTARTEVPSTKGVL